MNVERVAKRVADLEATCRYFNRDVHRAVFALPNYVRNIFEPDPFDAAPTNATLKSVYR